MCGKLEEKYGESPEAFLAEEEEPAADEPKADEKEEAPKVEEKEEKSEKKKTPRSKAAKKLRREALESSKLRRRILKTFYAKHAPEKTAEDVAAVIEKRSSRGDGWFDDLIGKLAEKYEEDPLEWFAENFQKSAEGEEAAGSEDEKEGKKESKKESKKEGKKKAEGGSGGYERETAVLTTFYNKYVPDKTADDIQEIIGRRASSGNDSWFEDLCAKLEKKYDVDPLAFYSLEGGGDDAAGGGEAAEEQPEPEPAPLTERELLLKRLAAATEGVEDLAALEEAVVAAETAAEERAAAKAAEDAKRAEEERIEA